MSAAERRPCAFFRLWAEAQLFFGRPSFAKEAGVEALEVQFAEFFDRDHLVVRLPLFSGVVSLCAT